MNEFDTNALLQEEDFETQSVDEQNVLELNEKDMAKYALRFSGLKADRTAKSLVSYCSFDNDAPEDDLDKNSFGSLENARVELTLDQMSGFYLLDLIFDNPNNQTLKLLWAKLQRHKQNETYSPDKLWIFFIKLIENLDDEQMKKQGTVMSANILNPLAYFLIRTVPDEMIEDYQVEPNVFCGGNTIRLLLHKDLVTFQYDTVELLDDDELELESEQDESEGDSE